MKIKYGLYDANGDSITGSSDLKCKIKRDADNWFFDFNDSTFKAAGHTSLTATMTEPDSTRAPGEYEKIIDESGWNDGLYMVYVNYSGTPKQNGSDEIMVVDGKEFNAFVARVYQILSYKMKVTDATGIAALRDKADGADLATGQISDDGTTTTRQKWAW